MAAVNARWLPLLAALACARPALPPPDDLVTLTVVGTNDLHGRIEALPWLAGHLRNLRAARAADGGAVLLVDAGDMFQGTLESNLAEGAPVVAAYNLLGYDAAAVGNHEFDYGPAGPAISPRPGEDPLGALRARAKEARFPLLAANVVDEATGAPLPQFPPSAALVRAGVRVAVIGALTEGTPRATLPANFRGLAALPLARAIEGEARRARAAGAQVVVAAVHEGAACRRFDDPGDLSSCDGGDVVRVVASLPAGLVDVVVAGHVHAGIAHRIAGVPVIESYSNGRAFGRVDLVVDRRRGAVRSARIHPPRPVCGGRRLPPRELGGPCRPEPYEGGPVLPDPTVAALLAPFTERARALRERPVGVALARPLPRGYREESALGNLIADLMRAARPGADVALTNGGSLRAELPAGPLRYGRLYQAFPFDNGFARLRVRGRELARIVARNLQRDKGIVCVSGLRVVARCERGRLEVALSRDGGGPIAPDEALTVITSDYLATGGDGLLDGIPLEANEIEGGETIRDAVAALLGRRGGVVDGADHFDPGRPRLLLPMPRPVRCAD